MRNFKFLATAIVAAMLACVLAFACFAATTPFKDVDDKNETLSDAVSLLAGLGVTKGTSENEFGTMQPVTRQQMAAFVYRLLKPGKNIEGGSNTTTFKDLTDSTYYGYISWANGKGIIKGTSATTFNPKGYIELQDAYTMVIRALGHEDDTYVYPFSYIDKAEALGLDEGLDSVVNYTTKLTRGDVAVILYNAFFAETGKEDTKKVVKTSSSGDLIVTKTSYNVTLAEDVYAVEIGDFEVRATNKYAFNDSKDATDFVPLCEEYEDDMIHLVAVDEEEELTEIICKFSETGLSGKSDDYIMTGVEVFYTYKTEKGVKQLDKVYVANGKSRVLETNSVTGYYEDGDSDEDFYLVTNANHKYEKVKGYVTVNNDTIYFFDAPYSYLKPDYNTIDIDALKETEEYKNSTNKPETLSSLLEDARYNLRNEKNATAINIQLLDSEKGTYSYYKDSSLPVDDANTLLANMQRVYSKGAYKVKFYDTDSDGIYEYFHYMPGTYGFMDGDDNKYFNSDMEGNAPIREKFKGSDLDVSFKPTIYYNEAKLSGASFNEGDLVVAYLNPDANMIDVMTVVKPYTGYINYLRGVHGQVKIDGTTFSTAYVYRAVENFYDDDDSNWDEYHNPANFYRISEWSDAKTFPALIDDVNHLPVGEKYTIWAYKIFGQNCVLWFDHLEDASIAFGMDELAIPLADDEHPDETYTKATFDAKLGDTVQHAKVYFNGKVSYIPLDVEEMYPALDEGYTADGIYNLSAIKAQNGYAAYVGKLCKVKKNSDGHYALIPLFGAEDDEGEYTGINNDSSTLVEEDNKQQFGIDLDGEAEGYIKKVSGNKYQLLDVATDETLLGEPFGTDSTNVTISQFVITGSTRIIIKNVLERGEFGEVEDYEFLEFTIDTFKGATSKETPLTNIQYILKGNPDSEIRADLVLLYAEADNFEFATKAVKNGWRIVIDSTVAKDEEGNYRNMYKLFNPYTGEIEENVPGSDSDDRAKDLEPAIEGGALIDVKKGEVDDEEPEIITTFDTSGDEGLVYLTEYVAEENSMTFVPVEAVKAAFENGDICCGNELEGFVDTYVYAGEYYNFDGEEFKGEKGVVDAFTLNYTITDNTVITVLKSDAPGADAVVEGTFTLADASVIADASKDYKCYNEKVINKKGNYTTVYANYVKAYVYAEKEADEGEVPEADFIIIVVNGEEDLVFADFDDNFYPKSHS